MGWNSRSIWIWSSALERGESGEYFGTTHATVAYPKPPHTPMRTIPQIDLQQNANSLSPQSPNGLSKGGEEEGNQRVYIRS